MDRRARPHFVNSMFQTHLIERIISQLKEFLWITKNSLILENGNNIIRRCRKCGTIRSKDRIFSPFRSIRTGCGAYHGLYQRVRGRGVKLPSHLPIHTEFKNERRYNSTRDVHRKKYIFVLGW